MVARGFAVLGSTEVKVEDPDDEGWGLPEWKVWISVEKVMVMIDAWTRPQETSIGRWD